MQIAPQTHMLTIPFQVPLPTGPVPRSVNLFLITGERITLIDSGISGAEAQIFEYLARIGRSPGEIDTLILTHSHPDHIGAALPIRQRSGCRVLAHGAERAWIEDVTEQARQRPVPGFADLVAGSVPVDGLLAHSDCLQLAAGSTLEVLHTPGHSAGSISLWHRDAGVLICGDAVPVPGDLPIMENLDDSLASLERLRKCAAELLLSSWDEPRRGDAVEGTLAAATEWLQRIRRVVFELAAGKQVEPLELCRQAVPLLGLPPQAVNPLVARSFMACMG